MNKTAFSQFGYNLLLYLAALPLLLYFLWRSRKDTRYRQRFFERLGWGFSQVKPGGLVVHAVSVGEVVAATPLIRKLQQSYPQLPITITCTTPTGLATIQQRFGGSLAHGYLPFDYPGAVARFLNRLQPRALIILETELWPNLMDQCYKAQIPVIVVNARLSARSARGYRRFYFFTATLMRHILLLLAQDRDSARRFARLRLSERIEITGNLKFDMDIPPSVAPVVEMFKPCWHSRLVWVAGSTHEGEDELLLQAYRQLKAEFPQLLLLLVPRHPERFDQVAELIEQQQWQLWRRSSGRLPDKDADVALADSMGELLAWYQLADLAFIGGSLIPHGGHNPLEAACFAKAIQTGPHYFNFSEAYNQLQRRSAVNVVTTLDDLIEDTRRLLSDSQRRSLLGGRAQSFFQQQQGVTERTLKAIENILGSDVGDFRSSDHHGQTLWHQSFYFPTILPHHFDPGWYQQQQAVIGTARGRNTAWFVRHRQQEMVLRHYYRGGLVGRILGDRFCYRPLLRSRAMQEFSLLQWMSQQGLPVPRPCAARYRQRGLFYYADILIERVPNSQDIASILASGQQLTAVQWQGVGAVVAQMHKHGVYHADLNCHNILVDRDHKVWLVDFDKCERRQPGAWQAANLCRLLRSLRKEKRKLQAFAWQENDWFALLQGYHSAEAAADETE